MVEDAELEQFVDELMKLGYSREFAIRYACEIEMWNHEGAASAALSL